MEHTISVQHGFKAKRPLGVWILTVYAALAAGIFPVLGLLILARTGFELSALEVWSTCLLAAAVVIAAISTWRGSNRARVMLLILITIHYGLIAANNAALLFSDGGPQSGQARLVGRILRGLLYPAMYVWYFRRAETMAFFLPAADAQQRGEA